MCIPDIHIMLFETGLIFAMRLTLIKMQDLYLAHCAILQSIRLLSVSC